MIEYTDCREVIDNLKYSMSKGKDFVQSLYFKFWL